jgi:hypothetical protein
VKKLLVQGLGDPEVGGADPSADRRPREAGGDGFASYGVFLSVSPPLPERIGNKVVLIPRGTRNDGFKRTWL